MKSDHLIENITKSFNIPYDSYLKISAKLFLEKSLKDIQGEIYEIALKNKVGSVLEFERKYKSGALDEFETFSDFKELDRLEFKKEQIESLLQSLSQIEN
jgi:hypothetical protein